MIEIIQGECQCIDCIAYDAVSRVYDYYFIDPRGERTDSKFQLLKSPIVQKKNVLRNTFLKINSLPVKVIIDLESSDDYSSSSESLNCHPKICRDIELKKKFNPEVPIFIPMGNEETARIIEKKIFDKIIQTRVYPTGRKPNSWQVLLLITSK
jgi:hypothetical protein